MSALAPVLTILRPGPLATVQDLGRVGFGRFGVSPSGALDGWALRVANRLVGNVDEAPALELTGPGAVLAFRAPVTFALAGADLDARLDEVPVPSFATVPAPAGARLAFPTRRRGARVIVAIAGGFEAPRSLGSAATDLDAGLGLRLRADDELAGRPRLAPSRQAHACASVYDDTGPLPFIPSDDAPESLVASFLAASYRVSPRSSRVGFRLEGPALPSAPATSASRPVAPGAVQLPPDGQPVLLLAERPTVGGYLVLGHLASVAEPRVAQLWPSDDVRFARTSRPHAHRQLHERSALLAAL